MILLCLDCEKTTGTLRALDFSPSTPQKTVIITSCIDELEQVFEVLNTMQLMLNILKHKHSLKQRHSLSRSLARSLARTHAQIYSGFQMCLCESMEMTEWV